MSCRRFVKGMLELSVAAVVGVVVLDWAAGSAATESKGIQRIEYDEPFGSWVGTLSGDRGKPWQMTGEMGPTLKDEQSGVELSAGRIFMLFRKYLGGRLIETFSTGDGLTGFKTAS